MISLQLLFGMPRSGTTFLARALECVPGVAVFGESDFFGRSYIEPGSDGRYDRRALARVIAVQANKDWTTTTGEHDRPLARLRSGEYGELVARALGRLECASPAAAFRAIAETIGARLDCTTVIEKTPGHLLVVERVAAALPDARCIATVREPAGFVRSFLQLDARDPRAAVRMLGRVSRHTALGVLMWRSYMRALERARACLGERLLIVPYARLAADPSLAIARAAAHLGVDAPSIDLTTLPRNASPDRQQPTPADLRLWLRLLAGELAGTELEDSQLPATTVIDALRSIVTLAPASVSMLARVLPQAAGRLGYVRDYLGHGKRPS